MKIKDVLYLPSGRIFIQELSGDYNIYYMPDNSITTSFLPET